MESQLKTEVLDPKLDLSIVAKKTKMYSGSDLKNVCVSAAIARVKETLVDDKERLDKIEDWAEYLKNHKSSTKFEPRPLRMEHIEIGLKECPPSLAEETESLVELRKWDSLYGDGAALGKGKKHGYGFQLPN